MSINRLHVENDDREIAIADGLAGRTQVRPLMKITPGQRLYYNYRFHQPSFERQAASAGRSLERRDFRSQRGEQDAQNSEGEP